VTSDTLALVGAAGGVGTTRLTLECATLLARDGRDVAVLDAAYGTQGLADRTEGRIDPDMTQLCLTDSPIEEGLIDRDLEAAGRLAVCPAHAPFERLARAKTPEAAEAFEDRIAEAARAVDFVIADTPPLAANQAVAAATATDRTAIVCDGVRAAGAIPRTEDRLADIGVDEATTVLTRTDDSANADVAVPAFTTDGLAVETDSDARRAIADVLEATLDVTVTLPDDAGLRSKLLG
jgi:septum site-determining protein MinD